MFRATDIPLSLSAQLCWLGGQVLTLNAFLTWKIVHFLHDMEMVYWTHVRGIKRWAVYSFLKRAIRWTFDSFFAVMWKKLLKIRHQRHNNHHVTSCCWNRRVQLILYFLVIFFFIFGEKKTTNSSTSNKNMNVISLLSSPETICDM